MKKTLKAKLVIFLAVAMLVSFATCVSAAENTTAYNAGDIIEFGMYPQTEITDETLLAELNAQTLEWNSYGYYSGNGSYGTAVSSDYMKYADVELDGDKYRAVTFTQYRPWQSEHDIENSKYEQQNNGYETETVYWFRFDPIKWKVLNPDTGLILCESIIDSQPFQNEVYQNPNDFVLIAHYADPEFTIPANTYSASSLKRWLEGDFTETAFSQAETEMISQNVHIISVADSTETDYGFDADKQVQDTERMRAGSDYAKIQGLQISVYEPGAGNSYWWLSDSVSIYQIESAVCYSGSANRSIGVSCTYIGVCPAVNIELNEVEYRVAFNNYDGNTEIKNYKFGESIADIPEPEREGYTFMGWDAEIPETMPAKNLEFNAIWKANTYNVVWNVDGVETTESYDYGTEIIMPEVPEKEGYEFSGWTPEVPKTMPANNLEFTAVFSSHSFEYSVSGDTITATCTGKYCPLENGDGGYVTISKPAGLCVDGNAVVDNQLVDKSIAVNVVYSTDDGTAPTEDGTYTASITLGNATATVEFSFGHTPEDISEENYVAPICTDDGSKDMVAYCAVCDEEISRETEIIEATGHADNDNDGYCDGCDYLVDPSVECEHACHKGGIRGFFWKIIKFFFRLINIQQYCDCGKLHYDNPIFG